MSESADGRKRNKVGAAEIAALTERADAVLDRAKAEAMSPDSTKVLRKFALKEVTDLLEIHPTTIYELWENAQLELPRGEKLGAKRLFTLEEIHQLQAHLQRLPRQRYGIESAVVVAVANFKGGVAKTFTSISLAQYLALRGFRTLAVDLDPQASMTSAFGVNPFDVDDRNTVLAYYYGEDYLKRSGTPDGWTGTLRSAIQPTYWHGLDLVAANLTLYGGEFALGLRRQSEPNFRFWRPLVDAIDTVRADYDVIVIDTPPSLSFSTTTALAAADGLIVPAPAAMPDMESCRAFFSLLGEVLLAVNERGTKKEFDFLKVLISRYQSDVAAQQRLSVWIRGIFDTWCLGEPMLSTTVVSNLGPRFQTLYEARPEQETASSKQQPAGRSQPRISRAALKRALESANRVNQLLESDIVSVFESRRMEREAAGTRAPAEVAA